MEEKILIPVVTFVLGIILKHLWDRFIRRTTVLRYSVFHQSLGSSSDSPLFGSVKILYNDTPVKNLFTSMINIINESSRDLKDLEINISSDMRSGILVSHATKRSIPTPLNFTKSYADLLKDDNAQVLAAKFARRDYAVPVLNRGQKIDILLLTTNFDGNNPNIGVACDYCGIRMRLRKQAPNYLLGESQQHSAAVGLVIGLVGILLISKMQISPELRSWISFTVGAFLAIIGVAVIKLFRFIRKIFT